MAGFPNADKMMQLQAQVRHNSEEIQEFFSDLQKWEDDVKKKDKALLKGDLNPTRSSQKALPQVRKKGFAEMVPSGMTGPKDKDRQKAAAGSDESRIKPKNYQDYNQWDKFVHKDLDKMLEDFDENDRQEQEEAHRKRLAENRAVIEERERLARLHIDTAEKLKNQGNDRLKTGDMEGAKVLYTQAIETDPQNAVIYANRAQVYLKLGQLADAIADCDAAIERDSRYVKAYMRRASARVLLGEEGCKDEAIADFKKVLMLEPNNTQAKKELAELTKPPLTPEEKALKEKEEAAARAKAEKDQRKKESGMKKLRVREHEEPRISAADADPTTNPQRPRISEVTSGGKDASNSPVAEWGDPPGKVGLKTGAGNEDGKKKVVTMQDALEIAEMAKAAVTSRLASEPVQIPANSIEFSRAWKRVSSDPDKLTELLLIIPPEKFASYFKSDIEDDVLSSIVLCIDTKFLPKRQKETHLLLQALVGIPRFNIAVKLMGRYVRTTLESILDRMCGYELFEPVAAQYRVFLQK